MRRLRFLFMEAFFGGSHREFALGWAENSRHEIRLLTLPARFWKWRMRGAALCFINDPACSPKAYDGCIASNMMSLSDFKSLAGKSCPPLLLYFHENQFAYPLRPGERMDYQYGFTDITSALAADRVIFNSHYHYRTFFSALPAFLKRMPEFRPVWVADAIRSRSQVLYPGCRFPDLAQPDLIQKYPAQKVPESEGNTGESGEHSGEPPLIIWNHRWEFDKAPDIFFAALDRVLEKGADFRLALMGENYRNIPAVFPAAKERYGGRLVLYGYVKNRPEYLSVLRRGDIAVSTAVQENFGISVVEAVRCGCIPLLPDRLSYPEILPEEFHKEFLYKDEADLTEKLYRMLGDFAPCRKKGRQTAAAMRRFAWENMIDAYDDMLEELASLRSC